jgi:hypothetical protein
VQAGRRGAAPTTPKRRSVRAKAEAVVSVPKRE